ncbi:MAG: HAD family phosphatase [Oscillospiraceae bacterium]|nr:HAD family phosphatase [Oscillospiraceae bacterium]
MNFIFDIGNVLLHFKPVPFLKSLFGEQAVIDTMYQTIFCSPEWERLDQGFLTHREAVDIFCTREPSFQPEIRQTMERLPDMLTPIADTVALLPNIKEAGHRLYYLSNFHSDLQDYVLGQYPFFNLFDGGVFSCDVKRIKPDPEIYRNLLDAYQLAPEDCVFVDDMEQNVTAAAALGMHGVLFTSADCVKAFLDNL